MSDSIGGAFKDLARETVKQVSKTPVSFAKSAASQIVGSNESEEQRKLKQAEKAMTHQRIKEIEAEMAHIRNQNEQKRSQEDGSTYKNTLEKIASKGKLKKMDEQSRQAVGKAEQGRNFKG
jgi:Zn-dependent M16 (insulinase) family peptidase